jgi:hypothetical protein
LSKLHMRLSVHRSQISSILRRPRETPLGTTQPLAR